MQMRCFIILLLNGSKKKQQNGNLNVNNYFSLNYELMSENLSKNEKKGMSYEWYRSYGVESFPLFEYVL